MHEMSAKTEVIWFAWHDNNNKKENLFNSHLPQSAGLVMLMSTKTDHTKQDLFIQRQASQQRRSTSNDIRHHLWATNTLISDQDHLQLPACQPVISSNLKTKTDSEQLSDPPNLMHSTCEMDSCSVGYCHRYWWVLLLSGAYWGTHPSLEMTKQAICRWCCWGVQPQQ